jgi:hypothetical protein
LIAGGFAFLLIELLEKILRSGDHSAALVQPTGHFQHLPGGQPLNGGFDFVNGAHGAKLSPTLLSGNRRAGVSSRSGLGSGSGVWQRRGMSTVTIALPDPLDAARAEQVKSSGARSKEEDLLGLVESDCAAGELERVLAERMGGPFAALEPDWKDRVICGAQRPKTQPSS